jgi:transposase
MSTDRSNEAVQTVHVVTSVQRRRNYSAEEKQRMVEEADQPGSSPSFVARKYGISSSLIFRWRRLVKEGGREAVGADEEVVPASEVRALKAKIRELERVLGRKTVENEILKEAVQLAHQKKLISRMPLLPPDDGE